MSERIPPHARGQPGEYRRDLSPDAGRDENVRESEQAADYPSAYETKDVHDRLQGFSDDELQRIPIVPAGTRLRQGATYTDLTAPEPREFTATAEMRARDSQRIVAKDDVDYETWNRLLVREDRPPMSTQDPDE